MGALKLRPFRLVLCWTEMAGSLYFHLDQSLDVACPAKGVTAEGWLLQ